MLDERLRNAWHARERTVPLSSLLHLAPDGLVFGVGTVVVAADGVRRLRSLRGQEARVLALLSAAFGKPVNPAVLGNIERAARSWSEGDDCLAHIHLAHSGLRALAGEESMSEIKFRYGIGSALPAHPESPASLGPKFLDTLDTLSRIDPAIFTNWKVLVLPDIDKVLEEAERIGTAAAVEKMEIYSPEEARSRIVAIVENNVTRGDLREPLPHQGYKLIAYTADVVESRSIGLRIKAGGKVGDTCLEIGDYKTLPDPALVTFPLFKAALLAINTNWPPRWAWSRVISLLRFPHPVARLFVSSARIRACAAA